MAPVKGPWVDGPYQLIESPSHRLGNKKPDPRFTAADSMTIAHNAFIRGINAMMLQAKGVSNPKDASDFCQYGHCLIESLHMHHSTEEEYFFPPLEKALGKPGAMQVNVQQHEIFHGALEKFDEYCKEGIKKPEIYDADTILDLLKKMSDSLVDHLHAEIETLTELEKADDPDGSKGKKCWDDWEVKVIAIADKRSEYPFVFGVVDKTYEDGMWAFWPPVPFFVPYLVKYVFGRTHAGAWRFSPCEWMKPRELQFLPKE